MRRWAGALASAVYLLGCADRKPSPKLPVAVVVGGDPKTRPPIERALATQPIDGIELRVTSLPPVSRLAADPKTEAARLGEVRKKYLAADVDGCLSLLGDDARIESLLAVPDRALAARVLFWRVACRIAGDQRALADRDATTFATFGLHLPADARDASPEVENAVDRAIQRVGNEPALELEVVANVPRARIRVDGRDETCLAPCVVTVARGVHVVAAAADGALPTVQRVAVDAKKKIALTLASAPPDAASSQWHSRYEGTADEQSVESARLLAIAVPSRYLVLLSNEKDAAHTRVRGFLYFDSDVRARAENLSGSNDAPSKVVDELLRQGNVLESRSIFKSPWFWIAAVGAAAAATTVTYFALQQPEERTEVRLR